MSTPSPSQIPRGFRFAATACGLKKTGGLDLALIASDTPATAAAVFTTNLVQAAPVTISREHMRKAASHMRAIVVNSGNANCCTGREGMAATCATAAKIAREIGCQPEEVIVCSTGVIGVPMKVERILAAAHALAASRVARAEKFWEVTHAIMTTDTRPKWAAAACCIGGKTVRVLGCAKGAGMIHPNMATMLAFLVTDASISPNLLRRALREVTAKTFNAITVDGDTSTNDTLAVLANGASGAAMISGLVGRGFSPHKSGRNRKGASAPEADYRRFVSALEKVCRELALAIVADGEGAQRVIEIDVRGARSDRDADRIARTIAHSPLVKTALAGADPNWGRILAAAGRAGVKFNPGRARIWLAGIPVFRDGRPLDFDERAAHNKLLAPYIKILFELGGHESRTTNHAARIYSCDFTAEYVRINASYRT
ncbi:MAG: bifunctional glutamate N-acetyltransferase/amino-acid acetyltransferase ArgJ [Acidobacteria bacterium]|nr:bifunctional glutamate N-acetyltransferase/amino-acid acetyltransferase ArgJ [Acidobacteriota bacterium]MBI3664297.1 bifunctional glutamate N-acetyltransferase/amino-acid acetyltransferase ArgJ [Acidobacteriota bacterium]